MLTNLKIFNDNGILVPIEFKDLPFEPKRIFHVMHTPKNTIRGCHAHLTTEQMLVCLQGEILVSLYNGKEWNRTLLKQNECIYVDKLIWDEQIYLTGNDILLSLCSTEHNDKDYIRDMEIFKGIKI